jgi:hypothetical protein
MLPAADETCTLRARARRSPAFSAYGREQQRHAAM